MSNLRDRKMVWDALQEANRWLEEICAVNLDLTDQGLRIVHQYHLLLSDINYPPRTEHNTLHDRITQLTEARDDPLASPGSSSTRSLPKNLMAANMVNSLLEMVAILRSDIEVLVKETQALFDVLFPLSMWSLCCSKVTGRCNIDDQGTRDIVDKWTTDSAGSEREIRWNDMINRAKDLLVDAGRVLAEGLHVSYTQSSHTGPMQLPRNTITHHTEEVDGMEALSQGVMVGEGYDPDENPAENTTASGSAPKASAKSTRRRKRKERGYLVGSEGPW